MICVEETAMTTLGNAIASLEGRGGVVRVSFSATPSCDAGTSIEGEVSASRGGREQALCESPDCGGIKRREHGFVCPAGWSD
jgi:hypothetical protein